MVPAAPDKREGHFPLLSVAANEGRLDGARLVANETRRGLGKIAGHAGARTPDRRQLPQPFAGHVLRAHAAGQQRDPPGRAPAEDEPRDQPLDEGETMLTGGSAVPNAARPTDRKSVVRGKR